MKKDEKKRISFITDKKYYDVLRLYAIRHNCSMNDILTALLSDFYIAHKRVLYNEILKENSIFEDEESESEYDER